MIEHTASDVKEKNFLNVRRTTMSENIPVYPDLAGKVALVTGGSRGIGASTCRLLAQSGVKVGVNGRDRAAIEKVVSEIREQGGQAIGLEADCTDVTALEQIRQQLKQEFGPVDIMAAFAGGQGDPVPTVQTSEEKW